MKKIEIALDFILLYKRHKKGALFYPRTNYENRIPKDKRRIGDKSIKKH